MPAAKKALELNIASRRPAPKPGWSDAATHVLRNRGGSLAVAHAVCYPNGDGTLDKAEHESIVAQRLHAANPDNDTTIDAKELRTAAGGRLTELLK